MEIRKIISRELLDSNTYIIETNDGFIIVEASVPVDVVKKATGAKKVLAVLLTHGHYDHAFYVDDYIDSFDCPIYVHQNAKAMLYAEVNNYSEGHFKSKSSEDRLVFLEDNGNVDVCGVNIKYYSTPGHSDCGMCYQIDGHLFSGDLLFDKGVGRTDLVTSNRDAMLESLKFVETLKFDTLHPGHGEDSSFELQQRNIAVFRRFLSRGN